MAKYTAKEISRFWSKVHITANPNDCWEWQASFRGKGYGSFTLQGKSEQAHRIAYDITYGDLRPELSVLHTCDNPHCVNPIHLKMGTNQDNVDDREQKGRNNPPRGEANGFHKLTRMQVDEIRIRYITENIPQHKLAREYGVSQAAISKIVRNELWVLIQKEDSNAQA